jgi:ATP-binding cassette, subfamily B, bacterial
MQAQQLNLEGCAWPLARLDEAVVRLSRAASLPAQVANPLEPPGDWGQTDLDAVLDHWVSHAAERLDLEVEQTEITVAGFDAAVRRQGAAILKIETQAQPQFFAILKCRAQWVALVAPDGCIHWKSLARLRDALVCDDTDPLGSELDAVLTDAGLSPGKRQKVNRTLMQERLAEQPIGTLIESEAIEAFFLNGGFFLMVLSVIKLVFAIGIAAAIGLFYLSVLAGYLTVSALVIWLYFRRCRTWTHARIQMTHTLIERMVGHRTRLVQEPRAHWHDREDQEMAGYMQVSQEMDASTAVLISCLPRLWLVVALLAMAPAWVASATSVDVLAVALGGMLMAYQGLDGLTKGVTYLISAIISWAYITPFLHADPPSNRITSSWRLLCDSSVAPVDETVVPFLTARHLSFQYPGHSEPVLQQCDLDIFPRDRLLLEGPSGGGKSTLVRLLTGLQQPDSGSIMLHGFDSPTLGCDDWQQRIIAAPQFHENQIFTGSVLFNLLMGRQWPPKPDDVQEARTICRELGLGPLLDRMPGGIYQMVGETGWQLSHGERSRLYIARALLQRPELVILDESFGVLDPDNLQTALECVQRRAPALMVIAHP